MSKSFKFIIILSLLAVLLVPSSFSLAATDTGHPVISHICVAASSTDMVALVVWPDATVPVVGTTGELVVSGGTPDPTTIDLTYLGTFGTASKWTGVVPSDLAAAGTSLTVTSGWVVDSSHPVENLPWTFKMGQKCDPTAVTLSTISAHSQSASPVVLVWTVFVTALGLVFAKRH